MAESKRSRKPEAYEGYSFLGMLWWRLAWVVARLLVIIFYRGRYRGAENVPKDGPVLVVLNHQSHFDPPLIGCGVNRPMRYMARSTLFGWKIFDRLMESLGAFPVEREGVGIEGIKKTLRALKQNQVVAMFAEGSRTHDGELQPFEAGVATIAKRAKATIVPAAIEGAYDVFPRGAKFPRLGGNIHVQVGEAIPLEQSLEMSDEDLIAEIRSRVQGLLDEINARPVMARQKARRKKLAPPTDD